MIRRHPLDVGEPEPGSRVHRACIAPVWFIHPPAGITGRKLTGGNAQDSVTDGAFGVIIRWVERRFWHRHDVFLFKKGEDSRPPPSLCIRPPVSPSKPHKPGRVHQAHLGGRSGRVRSASGGPPPW